MTALPAAHDDDRAAIQAVLAGDIERYAELVARYQAAAWRVAYSFVGNAEDAKELSQNAFVNAYRHLDRFRGEAKFSTWLYRIVANECKDFLRQKARRPPAVSLWPDPDEPAAGPDVPDRGPDPARSATNRELAMRMTDGIHRLSAQQREAFILHHLDGMPMDDVARVMGCRVGTVKVHVFRACERLRAWLEPFLAEELTRGGSVDGA